MSVTFGAIVFDYVDYDPEYDTLRLFVGGPPRIVDDYDNTEEGYGLDVEDGRIVGADILSPRACIANRGELVMTLVDGTVLRSPDVAEAIGPPVASARRRSG